MSEAEQAIEDFYARRGKKFLPSKKLATREEGDGKYYFRFSDGSMVVKSKNGDLQEA